MARDIVFQRTELVPIEVEIERYGIEDFTVRKTEDGTQINHINYYLARKADETEDDYLERAIDEGLTAIWG